MSPHREEPPVDGAESIVIYRAERPPMRITLDEWSIVGQAASCNVGWVKIRTRSGGYVVYGLGADGRLWGRLHGPRVVGVRVAWSTIWGALGIVLAECHLPAGLAQKCMDSIEATT